MRLSLGGGKVANPLKGVSAQPFMAQSVMLHSLQAVNPIQSGFRI
jgi:hypothetical protein